MGTQAGISALSMDCQVKGDYNRPASYVLSGGLSGTRYACTVHLAEAIDGALGEPILTPKMERSARVIVRVERAQSGPR